MFWRTERDLTQMIALGVMPRIPIQKISAIANACVAAFS
jgi:hypothetical protein